MEGERDEACVFEREKEREGCEREEVKRGRGREIKGEGGKEKANRKTMPVKLLTTLRSERDRIHYAKKTQFSW